MQLSLHSQYGKHIPKILRRQLILQLMEQYLNINHSEETFHSNECKPSIQRFHGALLFVDISGFTALSLQLSPEDLKFHINEYFTMMLDIVDRYGGDVIKFAGDALFIVWETSQMIKPTTPTASEHEIKEDPEDEPTSFREASRLAVITAVNCGLEINEICSNHKVSLLPRNSDASFSVSGSFSVSSPPPTPHGSNTHAMLNVHSGVTVGLMAGIDIGCNDRWEYFLMGEPLTSVAMAEAQASTGEIVICPDAHDLLHPAERPTFNRALARISIVNSSPTKRFKRAATQKGFSSKYDEIQGLKKHNFDESAVDMPCGCLKGSNGYCKVKKGNRTPTFSSRRNKLKSKFEESFVFDETNREIEAVFDTFVGHRLQVLTSVQDIQREFIQDLSHAVTLNVAPVRYAMSSVVQAALNVKTVGERVKTEFMKWAHSCLIDDIARHVHDVVRSNYVFEDTSRIDVCRREVSKQLATINAPESVMKAKEKFRETLTAVRLKKMEKQAGILDGTKKFLKKSLTYGRLSLSGSLSGKSFSSSGKGNRLFDQDSAEFTAELRSVTVMFVKIDMPHMDLTVEDIDFGEHIGQFGFLSKTVNESLADVLLLHQLQSCMEALNEAFSQHGGQLRQFIVDDKGTVCIGTFGLRGAVSDDNAAAAVETAYLIVNKLQTLGLNCSIGLTLGKAFCGLVGSANRHEYAVMGPSTNLSARLMCKAALGGIICDKEIRNHDRTHEFVTLADIVAKGYAKPVGTCKPVLKTDEPSIRAKIMGKSHGHEVSGNSMSGIDRRASVNTIDENGQVVNKLLQRLMTGPYVGGIPEESKGNTSGVLMGRDNEVRGVLAHLFGPLVGDDSKLRLDLPSRFAAVLGPQGIGKSSILEAVSQKVSTVVVSGRHLTVDIFKTKMSGFQSAVPCSAWRYVVREMMIKLYNVMKNKENSIRRLGGLSVDFAVCVKCLKELLPEELRKFEPLLGHMKIAQENAVAMRELELNHDEMALKCIELMNAILRVYIKQSQRLVLIIAENAHQFDVVSQLLLQQVCTRSEGMVVLFSAERTIPLAARITPKSSTHAASVTASSHDFESQIIEIDAVNLLMKHEACYCVDLSLLPRDQIESLIKVTLANAGIASVDERVMTRICDESGGNPMYARELAKSVAQKHNEQIDLTRVSVKVTNCHRLEEIICHRFDQLSNSAQTLLKIAAAICHFGSSFSYGMLHFVMVEDEQQQTSTTDEHLVEDLLDIVNSESFLRAFKGDGEDPDDDFHEREITAEGIAENQYTFSFSISLEKSTIYELLLGDQKQMIHERIAEYFLQLRQNDPQATQQHFKEEGLHWQIAGKWSFAMACSYHASLAEPNEHKAAEHIDTAYRMYQALKEQFNINTGLCKCTGNNEWDLPKIQTLFELALTNSEDLAAINASSTTTVEEVSQLFDCDSELLLVSLQVIVAKTRRRLVKASCEENRRVLEDALQMLLLTKNSKVLSTERVTQLMQLLSHSKDAEGSGRHDQSGGAEFFTIGEAFVPLALKMLSLYVEVYLLLDSHDQLFLSQDKVVFLLSRLELLQEGHPQFHEVHALSLKVRLSCKSVDFSEAVSMAEKIVTSYQFEKHSADLVQFYGRDCIPASLAMISQYLLLSSEWSTPHKFLQLAHQSLERLIHVESIQSAVYFVTNSLVFLKRFDEALKLFTHYLDCVALIHEDRQMVDGFYLEWLNRLVRFSSLGKTNEAIDTLFEKDVAILNEFLQSSHHVVESGMEKLDVQGRGINVVLAEVCALKIIVLWNSSDLEGGTKMDELRVYCRAFCGYARETLQLSSGRPHELIFGKTNTVLTMLHVLQEIGTKVSPLLESSKMSKRNVLARQPTRDSTTLTMTIEEVVGLGMGQELTIHIDNSSVSGSVGSRYSGDESDKRERMQVIKSSEADSSLDKPALLSLLLSVVDDVLFDSLIVESQNVYSECHSHPADQNELPATSPITAKVTKLGLLLLNKTKIEIQMSLGVVKNPPSFDENKELWKLMNQFMAGGGSGDTVDNANGSSSGSSSTQRNEKVRFLQWYSLSETAPTLSPR